MHRLVRAAMNGAKTPAAIAASLAAQERKDLDSARDALEETIEAEGNSV